MNTHADNDLHANDLTQLSSREQLSALMDGALPADQTRFLLRRLQHDASLADSWARWRLSGEVMRGLAPAQRLPADFASRVSMALHADGSAPRSIEMRPVRKPAWLRWGGGVAVAASLAVVALMARQPASQSPAAMPASQVASAEAAPAIPVPRPAPVPQAPSALADAPQMLAAAGAAVARPARNRSAEASRVARSASNAASGAVAQQAPAGELASVDAVPAPVTSDIVTRPWPRSVLSQYSDNALTVGFGDRLRTGPVYSPFPSTALRNLQSPAAPADQPVGEQTGAAEEARDASVQPQP